MRKFLVVEGLIGVGKTTLCKILAERWSARLVLEPWEDNPFLASFYADPERFAFPAQMFYLASRFQQQQNIRQEDLFSQMVVSDYLFEKDRLFAEQTLAGHEFALYDRFAGLLSEGLTRPDLVVFLDAPTEVILGRIKKRAIASEQAITAHYLDSLRDRYYRLWESYTGAPIRIVHTGDRDYVSRDSDREAMLGLLRGWLDGPGGEDSPGSTPASANAEREGWPSLFGATPKDGDN